MQRINIKTHAMLGLSLALMGSAGLAFEAQALLRGETLTGRVWVDTNQNGIWDSGEKPLRDVTVTIGTLFRPTGQTAPDPWEPVFPGAQNNTGERIFSVKTDANGRYEFANMVGFINKPGNGEYQMVVGIDRPSSPALGPNDGFSHRGLAAPYSLAAGFGTQMPIISDATDMVIKPVDTGQGEGTYAPTTVRFVDGVGNVLTNTAGQPLQANLDVPTGSFTLTSVPRYCNVDTFVEVPQGSSWRVGEADAPHRQPFDLCNRLLPSVASNGYPLYVRHGNDAAPASVDLRGRVILDSVGLGGVTMRLRNYDGSQVMQVGSTEPVAPVVTGTNGYYAFRNVPPRSAGKYYVSVRWAESPALIGTRLTAGSTDWAAILAPEAGQSYVLPTIGFEDKPATENNVTITGTAYVDRNLDGERQADEPLAPAGTRLKLWRGTLSLLETTVAADGTYRFSGLSSQCGSAKYGVVVPVAESNFVGGPDTLEQVSACRWSDNYTVTHHYGLVQR